MIAEINAIGVAVFIAVSGFRYLRRFVAEAVEAWPGLTTGGKIAVWLSIVLLVLASLTPLFAVLLWLVMRFSMKA